MSNEFEEKYKHWHQRISYIKSGIRLVGGLGTLVILSTYGEWLSITFLAIALMLAELLGIAEEWI